MNSKKINLYVISLIFVLLDFAYAFISKTLLEGTSTVFSLICFLSFLLIYKDRKTLSKAGMMLYLFMSWGVLFAYRFDPKWSIIAFVRYLPLLTLFMLKPNDLKLVRDKLVKSFGLLVFISLVLYLLKTFGLRILYSGNASWMQYNIDNYSYIYTDSLGYENAFTGFCVESGYFAFLCICLLALTEFDFKNKYSIIFAVGVLLSMSLEGYLLLVSGTIFYAASRGKNTKKIICYTLITIIIISVIVAFAMNYNGGNNILGEKIFARLAFDKDLGIAGNNRESSYAEAIIDRVFYSNRVWIGIGQTEYYNILAKFNYDICSWRMFVVIYGSIYTIIAFFISLLGLKKTNMRKTLPFFLIFWMDFYPHGSLSSESLYILVIIFLLNTKGMHPVTTRK